MPDIATIGAVLSSVKTATEIAKLIRESDASLADAETKLKIADLISALADVKLEMAEVHEALLQKDQEIMSLKQQLSDKESLGYDGQLYWSEGDSVPFCTVCLERDSKHHHLTYSPADSYSGAFYHCKVCSNVYHQNA